MQMKTDIFYQRIVENAGQSPNKRYVLLADLHADILARYLNAVRTITSKDAARVSTDGRTLGQVVGHIAEWERFTMLAVGEMMVGAQWPRIMSLSGYIEPDGQVLNFTGVDDFNAYQANKHATWPWERIQELTIRTATMLHVLFTQPALMPAECLELTRVYEWHLPGGVKLAVPAGWYLWMVTLEHEAVEHADDLGLDDGG
jgi:hypothetical protein